MDLNGVWIPNSLKDDVCGWLDPDGTFHECNYMEHLNMAFDLYGTYDTEALAQRGIVHIFWDPIKNRPDYYIARCLTDTQINWLENNDFTVRSEDIGKI